MRGLTSRLLVFNLLLAVFPVGALFFLGTYEAQLLESQERAMVQQGRLLASAFLGGDLAEEASAVLERLGTRNDSRLRVVDLGGRLLADSARPAEPEAPAASPAPTESAEAEKASAGYTGANTLGESEPDIVESAVKAAPGTRIARDAAAVPRVPVQSVSPPEEHVIYRIGAWPARAIRRITRFIGRPRVSGGDAEYYIGREVLDGPEIRAALEGRYGAATRISQGQISVTLYSAIPIFRRDSVIGAVLVSRSTLAILNALYQLRLDITVIFLLSVGAAVLLSILLARTVTVPVGRLRTQAESLLDERGKLQARFKPLAGRDEVADLSRALHQLSSRLQERTDHLEDFMADLVHEMKNPVAGILSAAELADAAVSGEARRFIDVIDREGRRIQHLLDDLRELISVDVRLNRSGRGPVDIVDLVRALAASYPRRPREDVRVKLFEVPRMPVFIDADAHRLTQAVLNLVDNAVTFSPKNGSVDLNLYVDQSQVAIHVADHGPGIPKGDSEKIFERWYTDRPEEDRIGHTGLGLAIVRGIAMGYGGRVYSHSPAPESQQPAELQRRRQPGSSQGSRSRGAVFVLEFPRSRA